MPLLESILTIWGTATGTVSGLNELKKTLAAKIKIEDVLTKLVKESFDLHITRLQHLCHDGPPDFDEVQFRKAMAESELQSQTSDELPSAILPYLSDSISLPGASCPDTDFKPIYLSIANSAVRGLWKKIGTFDHLSNETILNQNSCIRDGQEQLASTVIKGFLGQQEQSDDIQAKVSEIQDSIKSLASFSREANSQTFNQLLDAAPPQEHTIDNRSYINPFLRTRSEDFNHNYAKLARLFQQSPEWDSIQSRTENVFIEGGRGTGKSMLLRRLTAQATVAAERLKKSNATFNDVGVDYFGIYVKLTRGYYDRFGSTDIVGAGVAKLLAQQELNVEIFDAFVDAVVWLQKHHAIPELDPRLDAMISDLCAGRTHLTD